MESKISEWATRKKWIDAKLISAGWTHIIPYSEKLDFTSLHNAAVEELPSEAGPADYVLFLHGQPVAIVEAKKLGVGPQNVLEQAKRYAKGLTQGVSDFSGYKVPFLYATNGEIIWFQDVRPERSRSREVKLFHTTKAIQEMIISGLNQNLSWFIENPPADQRLRYYQRDAITAIEAAIQDDKRSMLVAMATGTGKTFTIASLVYRLLKSGASKRVLFLVDRKALAAQAVTTFASYEPEPNLKFTQIYQVYSQRFQRNFLEGDDKFDFNALPEKYLTDPDGNQVFVYVSTIQRMQINLFGKEGMFSNTGEYDPEDDADKLDIPIHTFDTIIADECHRGYTSQEVSKWRDVLEHFDATKIGLTATPAAHTTSYFKHIVYRYPYETAVKDGFLVDYDAVKIDSGFHIEGITVKEGEEVEEINPDTGVQQLDLLEDEKHFETTELEREVTSPDSNRKIIEEYAKHALGMEKDLGRFPKTLIFANNDLPHISHADQLVNICRDIFGRGDDFVKKITGSPSVDRPLQRIREFRNRPDPHIVVTVDMLSTGIDIPSLECIVFLRPVKSRILFEQMMGRGTRLCPEINKTHFTVFDCFGGTLLEAFKAQTGITQETPMSPTRTIEQIIQEINDNIDVEYNTRCLVKRFQRIHKNITAEGRDAMSKFIPDGDIGKFAQTLPDELKQNRVDTLKTLTNPDFIELLKHYPRAASRFIKALEAVDTVKSEYLFRTTDGRELKPDDYLKAFEQFVKDNPEHIEAISIVLKKPNNWNTQALKELRTSLKQQPERFTEDSLRKAYKYPLADIISMVKHAGKDEPLLSARDRVDMAIDKVLAKRKLTEKQQEWMELIRQHLIENLTIEQSDFDGMLIFTRRGGNFNRINSDFDNQLPMLIQQINTAIPEVYAYATN